uniref:BED-type domain-containing protein n=1 Tax=Oryza barthii TaxID=65489 RepID=A0A0D3F361_9ORYZ
MAEEESGQASRTTGQRRKRSEYWDHFEHKAECNYCKALLCADPVRDGTSRLKKHYGETCPARHPNNSGRGRPHGHGSPAASSEQQENHVLQNASTISKSTSDGQQMVATAAVEDQLIRMIALGFPSSMVEDVQFIRFVGMLCPEFKMPSRDDVEERCDALFDQETSNLKDAIARTPGLISLSIGRGRTAMVDTVFLAAHFIDDEWNLCRRVIRVFKDHDFSDNRCDHILDVKDYYNIWHDYDEVEGTISSCGLFPKLVGAILDNENYTDIVRNKLYKKNHLKHLSASQRKLFHATDMHWELDMATDNLIYGPCGEYGSHWLFAFMELCLTKKKHRDISSRLKLNHPWTYDRYWYALYYALQFLHNECSSSTAEIAGLVGDDTFQETVTSELFRTTLGMIYNAIETVAGSSSPTSNLSLIELVKLKIKKCTNASRRKDDNDDEDTDEEEIDDSDDEGNDEEQTNDARCSFKKLKEYLNKVFEKTYLSQSIPLILDPRFKLVKVERLLENASLPPDRISEVQAAVVQLFQDYSNQGNAREHTNHNNENVMDIDPFHQIHNSTFQTVGQPTRMARDFLAIPTSTRPTPQMMTEITNHLRRYA